MKAILLIDVGSTNTKVTAVDVEKECIMGTARAFTTVETDIDEGLQKALKELYLKTGVSEYSGSLACSSAAGGLKMVAVGLIPALTAEAARMAALSAGAKVLKTFSHELSAAETQEIFELKPDILLLSGGTDGGNSRVILHNARMIAGIELDFPVVVAGNKSTADEVKSILSRTRKEVWICENVMPELNVLNIEPARRQIRDIFLQNIIKAKGITKVKELSEGILMPTPSAVLNAAHFLAVGAGGESGIGDLMVVDVGGATTDVYSITDGNPCASGIIFKGLPEPYDKRTVEGDLGVRYNTATILNAAGIGSIAHKSGLTPEDIDGTAELLKDSPWLLPKDDEKIRLLDKGLAAMAVKIATDRHAGKIETVYTPFGAAYVQTGKDLGRVRYIIGTGGPVINCSDPGSILGDAMFDITNPEVLKPKKAECMVDNKYILAAMGLLCTRYPEIAVRIMKKELKSVYGTDE